MPDREKAIKGLECCIDPLKARCPECPYYPCYDEDTTSEKLLADALALLKAQEPQEPLIIRSGWIDEIYNRIAECPECGMDWAMWLPDKMRYCPGCGKAVKWDAEN